MTTPGDRLKRRVEKARRPPEPPPMPVESERDRMIREAIFGEQSEPDYAMRLKLGMTEPGG